MTFSEPVDHSTVNAADFQVDGTTSTDVHQVSLVGWPPPLPSYRIDFGGSPFLYEVNGTVTLSFKSTHGITDPAGNALVNVTPTSGTNDNFFVVDNTAPTVTSIERNVPTTSPTNANSLTWRVTFSEALHFTSPGPGTDDFVVSGTTASVANVRRRVPSSVFNIGVAGGDLNDLNDTVTLTFATGQNITDPAGNALVNVTPTSVQTTTSSCWTTPPRR